MEISQTNQYIYIYILLERRKITIVTNRWLICITFRFDYPINPVVTSEKNLLLNWCENNLVLNLILIESVFTFENYKQNITKGVSGNITNKPRYIYIYIYILLERRKTTIVTNRWLICITFRFDYPINPVLTSEILKYDTCSQQKGPSKCLLSFFYNWMLIISLGWKWKLVCIFHLNCRIK